MNKVSLRKQIKDDLYRQCGSRTYKSLLSLYFKTPGFRIMFWFRIASHYRGLIGFMSNLMLMHYRYLFGINLYRNTKIGRGFCIGHFSGIVISPKAVIGDNCNISQNVTIGVAGKGEDRGVPTIGNGVYIGAGAVVIGKIKIGENVAIGANAVVTKDVPDNAVVVGIPAQVKSFAGADGIIINKV